jgi:hypothetical protein
VDAADVGDDVEHPRAGGRCTEGVTLQAPLPDLAPGPRLEVRAARRHDA